MTVATELAKGAGRLEVIMCIEGIGWPVAPADLTQGFKGDVWATSDLDGNLNTILDGASGSCTLHMGLDFNTDARTYNVRDGSFTSGSMTGSIVDGDDWFADNFYPSATETTGIALSADLDHISTSVDIDDATLLTAGQTVWINGVEAVVLGSKSSLGGTNYRFTSSTRGAFGTHRGNPIRSRNVTHGFIWPSGSRVADVHQVWYNRFVQLYAHVPGESAGNMVRIFNGRLRGIKQGFAGDTVTFNAIGSAMLEPAQQMWKAGVFASKPGRFVAPPNAVNRGSAVSRPEMGYKNSVWIMPTNTEPFTDFSTLAFKFRYRTEAGGTAGARNAWANTPDTLQANDVGEDSQVVMRYMKLGDRVYLAEKCVQAGDALTDAPVSASALKTYDRYRLQVEAYSSMGTNGADIRTDNDMDTLPDNAPVQFLLENWFSTPAYNDYSRNGVPSRNPVDIFLHHLLSRDDEYVIGDAAAGSTTTTINFSTTIAPSTDYWVGAALYCVEGTGNELRSRVISSNTTTSITVEDAFPAAVTIGDEFQVRNSVYDTLPWSWGLGVSWLNVDIDSFEEVRDKYLSTCAVEKFIIGVTAEMNLWDLLRENILHPYGIAVSVSGTTGKMTARYIGEVTGDGVDLDYVTVTESDVLGFSDIDYDLFPIGQIKLVTRATEDRVVSYRTVYKGYGNGGGGRNSAGYDQYQLEPVVANIPVSIGSEKHNQTIWDAGVYGYNEDEYNTVEWTSEFDTMETGVRNLQTRAIGIIRHFARPRPQMTLRVDFSYLTQIELGDIINVTSIDNIANPFLSGGGWANVLARVLGINVMWRGDDAGIALGVELLTDVAGGRIAPAANLGGALSGSDGTSAWFEVDPTTFVADAANDKDYYHFAVGDRIEVRDSTAATKASVYTIRSFGANDVSDPTAASSDIIRINEAAPGGLVAGDYLTFSDWSASNTARMDLYAGLADPTTDLLAAVDPARRYG